MLSDLPIHKENPYLSTENDMKTIFITGVAGFIGSHLQKKLRDTFYVYGIDTLASVASKKRAELLSNYSQINLHSNFLDNLPQLPDLVIHLAAETGISGSLTNPELYFHQNVEGTFNVLEQCRKNGVKYLIYASSSSVYEPSTIMSEHSPHNNQLSFYGTSKRMTEIMVENYCRQFGITAIGLRFFTVYGSWTRPDMAAYKFMDAIQKGNPITLFNNGNVYRDFTHVSDIVKSIRLLVDKIVEEPLGTHKIFNIGCGAPVSIRDYAQLIAENLGKELFMQTKPLPINELKSTHSDTSKLENYIGFKPMTTIEQGIKEMVEWYKRVEK
jgi:UDP-glucuronate 4-epimerase